MEIKGDRFKIAVVVAFTIIASLMIPMERWSCSIVSGRYVSEARIVERDEDEIAVRLYNMTADRSKLETNTFLILVGNVPSDAYVGQDIQIGYSYDGLYENTSQSVQVAYREDSNLFMWAVEKFIPFTSGAQDDLKIVDIQPDGALLSYNRAS